LGGVRISHAHPRAGKIKKSEISNLVFVSLASALFRNDPDFIGVGARDKNVCNIQLQILKHPFFLKQILLVWDYQQVLLFWQSVIVFSS
jgi:hypothetical protein